MPLDVLPDPTQPDFNGLVAGTPVVPNTPVTQEGSALINQEVMKLEPDALVQLFILDARSVGGDVVYFHAGTNKLASPITYQGIAYYPIPVDVSGFEMKAKGELPRPTIKFSNIGGFMKDLVLLYEDLVGANIIRRRVYAKYLDGQPTARPDARLPDDIFTINRKTSENRYTVEFELSTAFEVDGVQLPRRQIISNLCPFMYRGDGCFFAQKRVVAGTLNNILGNARYYMGYWSETTHYVVGNAVSEPLGDYEIVYVAHQATVNQKPSENPTVWIPVQRVWLAPYDATKSYQMNDVVFVYGLRKPTVPLYFIAWKEVPPGMSPPNKTYWQADECGKLVPSCQLHFDPATGGNVTIGPIGSGFTEYDPAVLYAPGDKVSITFTTYMSVYGAIVPTKGQYPPSFPTVWSLQAPGAMPISPITKTTSQRKSLPYGGFPGTVRIPDTVA